LWYPYAVIEIGKNHLVPGHEREYAACTAIVLQNVLKGVDKMNNIEQILKVNAERISTIPMELRELLRVFADERQRMLTTRRVQILLTTRRVKLAPGANLEE